MRGTRLDYLIVFGVAMFSIFIIIAAINPARSLAYARDEQRSDDVRHVMAAVLQMSVDYPEKYQALLKRLNDHVGTRLLIGNAKTCSGDWGAHCSDVQTADDCLPISELFPLTTMVPIDPVTSLYGTFGTGYYLSLVGDSLEAGSCAADTGMIRLQSLVR